MSWGVSGLSGGASGDQSAATLCHFKDYFESHFDYALALNNRAVRVTMLGQEADRLD
jgi:hypothetical protein